MHANTVISARGAFLDSTNVLYFSDHARERTQWFKRHTNIQNRGQTDLAAEMLPGR